MRFIRALRQRIDLMPGDDSRDAEILAWPPGRKLEELVAWELGDGGWADSFLDWAEDAGYEIRERDDELRLSEAEIGDLASERLVGSDAYAFRDELLLLFAEARRRRGDET